MSHANARLTPVGRLLMVQPEPTSPTATSINRRRKLLVDPNASTIASRSEPEGAPPPSGLIDRQ